MKSLKSSDSTSPPRGAMVSVQQSRTQNETYMQALMARQFPRDETEAIARIETACRRVGLAEVAIYEYPRGGQTVSGPSIRLAEALAQSWGNLDFGITEVERRRGASQMMAYCWDLERNTRQTMTFEVPHSRYTKQGTKELEDPRDIYEMIANQAARRLRSCILRVIPGDVVDTARRLCLETLSKAGGEVPLADRVKRMAVAFRNDFGVDRAMLEKRLGHKLEVTSESELVRLRNVYNSLRDGMATVAELFDAAPKSAATEESEVADEAATGKPTRSTEKSASRVGAEPTRTEAGDEAGEGAVSSEGAEPPKRPAGGRDASEAGRSDDTVELPTREAVEQDEGAPRERNRMKGWKAWIAGHPCDTTDFGERIAAWYRDGYESGERFGRAAVAERSLESADMAETLAREGARAVMDKGQNLKDCPHPKASEHRFYWLTGARAAALVLTEPDPEPEETEETGPDPDNVGDDLFEDDDAGDAEPPKRAAPALSTSERAKLTMRASKAFKIAELEPEPILERCYGTAEVTKLTDDQLRELVERIEGFVDEKNDGSWMDE